jgi:hypothetical protein
MFAMPVFDWDDYGAPVVRAGFEYYWAVTIPLTLVVLLSWAFINYNDSTMDERVSEIETVV